MEFIKENWMFLIGPLLFVGFFAINIPVQIFLDRKWTQHLLGLKCPQCGTPYSPEAVDSSTTGISHTCEVDKKGKPFSRRNLYTCLVCSDCGFERKEYRWIRGEQKD